MDIQIFDNGGKTRDRYCLIVDDSVVYTMAGDSRSLKDIKYLCEMIDLDRKAAGELTAFEDLPETLRRVIEINGKNGFGKVYRP
jgi:hypothetical protein